MVALDSVNRPAMILRMAVKGMSVCPRGSSGTNTASIKGEEEAAAEVEEARPSEVLIAARLP